MNVKIFPLSRYSYYQLAKNLMVEMLISGGEYEVKTLRDYVNFNCGEGLFYTSQDIREAIRMLPFACVEKRKGKFFCRRQETPRLQDVYWAVRGEWERLDWVGVGSKSPHLFLSEAIQTVSKRAVCSEVIASEMILNNHRAFYVYVEENGIFAVKPMLDFGLEEG